MRRIYVKESETVIGMYEVWAEEILFGPITVFLYSVERESFDSQNIVEEAIGARDGFKWVRGPIDA